MSEVPNFTRSETFISEVHKESVFSGEPPFSDLEDTGLRNVGILRLSWVQSFSHYCYFADCHDIRQKIRTIFETTLLWAKGRVGFHVQVSKI